MSQPIIDRAVATAAADYGFDLAKVRAVIGERAFELDGAVLVDGVPVRDFIDRIAQHRDLTPEPDVATMGQAAFERRRSTGWSPPLPPDPGRRPVPELTALQRKVGSMSQPEYERWRAGAGR